MHATKSVVIATEKVAIRFINPKQIVRTPGGAQRTTIGMRSTLFAAVPGIAKPAAAIRNRPAPVVRIIGIAPDAGRNMQRLRCNVPITAVTVIATKRVANAYMNPKQTVCTVGTATMKPVKRITPRILSATIPTVGTARNTKAFWKSAKPVPTSGIAKVAVSGMRSANPVQRRIIVTVQTVKRYWE